MVLVGVAITAGLTAITLIFEQWTQEAFIPHVWSGLRAMAARPAGFFGVVLAVELLVLVLVAFLETSPTVQRVLRWQRTRRRSPEEIVEVERLREMWSHDAREACEQARQGLGLAIRYLTDHKQPLASLLWGPVNDLRAAAKAFEGALAPEAVEPLPEVQRRLRALVDAYGACAVWYNRCRRLDPTLINPQHSPETLSTHRTWVTHHRAFIPELERVFRRAAYRGVNQGVCAEELSWVKAIDDPPLAPELLALDAWPRP